MTSPKALLTVHDHDRAAVGLEYVYPVISRRSGGVSVGINLNVNNACNWRCIYCQVPDLKRGGPPPVNLALLRSELQYLLNDIVHGGFMARHVPEEMRRLNDIALSGNGEPTSAPEFSDVIDILETAMIELHLLGKVKAVLISNGSLMHKPYVQAGLRKLATLGGEVWFKLDRATQAGMQWVNQTESRPERVLNQLKLSVEHCPTWLQTCVFAMDGRPPPEVELAAYTDFLLKLRAEGIDIEGVLLYGLARPSLQAEASRLSALPQAWLEGFAERIRASGQTCRVFT